VDSGAGMELGRTCDTVLEKGNGQGVRFRELEFTVSFDYDSEVGNMERQNILVSLELAGDSITSVEGQAPLFSFLCTDIEVQF
jgi:hypothetical protein